MRRSGSFPVLAGLILFPSVLLGQTRSFPEVSSCAAGAGAPSAGSSLHWNTSSCLPMYDSYSYTLRNFQDQETRREEFPDPESVLYRSLILPGWGQVTNRQIWKVPIIYGIFAGVIYYNIHLTTQYRGFRAAYYNRSLGEETDFKFGPTPDFVPSGWNAEQLRATRDNLRNQRDFSYVMIFLAYGLNAIDAYVFAHMRSFDVSDDLSAVPRMGPAILDTGAPGVYLQVRLLY